MKINKMTGYAFRILRAIYLEEETLITSNVIAERENISQGVVMKVITSLKTNGIVASHQGRGRVSGGYSLACPIEQITCLDIIEIMEGPIRLSIREVSGRSFPIDKELQRIENVMRDEMNKNSIRDLIDQSQKK